MGLAANFLFFSVHGIIFTLPARMQAFSKEKLSKHEALHQKTFGKDAKIADLGHPD